MQSKHDQTRLAGTWFLTVFLCVILAAAAVLVYFLLPNAAEPAQSKMTEPLTIIDLSEETEEELSAAFQDYFTEVSLNRLADDYDNGLALYRQPLSRTAVEWFYFQITGSREVTQAIITEAEKNDIPLSLAFSLAHTESNFNTNATNRNANSSIDRGLFQLNSNSFPELSEADFFDPFVSSRYGMAHLKFCLNTAGNEVSALSNKTPQSTLNYVGKIMSYQKMLDQLFEEQVASYFETQLSPGIAVAYAH